MWIIQAKSKRSGQTRRVVCSQWARVMELSEVAMAKGWRVTINQYFTDVLIARSNGEFIVAAQKITPREAAKLSHQYARIDRERGLVLWPHGQQLPDGWSVIPREAI
jgi:hypothetical protein